MALATKKDFEARYGAADERTEPLLEDASALILSEVSAASASASAEWATADDPKAEAVPAIVKAICVEVAYRAWSNPDSFSSEHLGEHTQAWADRSGQALRLTPSERRILEREASVSSVVSVTLESPYAGPPIESDLIE
jgi:hypothetical protein